MIDKTLHFDSAIENWDEALPLGNGDIGCLSGTGRTACAEPRQGRNLGLLLSDVFLDCW